MHVERACRVRRLGILLDANAVPLRVALGEELVCHRLLRYLAVFKPAIGQEAVHEVTAELLRRPPLLVGGR